MANREFGPALPDPSAEKLCGPACSVLPNMRGYTAPHTHRVARYTTPEGFPLHNVYPDPPTVPPKAYYGFERKGGIRRSGEQPRADGPQTLLDDPELRRYSESQTQHTGEGSASQWQRWRSWGAIHHRRRHGSDHGNDVELDYLRRTEVWQSAQQAIPPVAGSATPSSSRNPRPSRSARQSFVIERPIPTAQKSPTRRTLSVSTTEATSQGEATIRHPVANSPVLRCIHPDYASTTKATMSYQATEAPSRGRDFNSRFPRYHAIEPSQVGSRLAKGKARQRTYSSASRPGSRPVSPKSNSGSLRRIASHNAAMRSRAQSLAASPPRSPRVSPPTSPNTRERRLNLEESFTLRHVQRLCQNQIKARITAIEESRKRFGAISAYEMISNDIFQDIQRVCALKVAIDEDNLQRGSLHDDDNTWAAFLFELDLVEKAIETEDERLRIVIEVRWAEQERKSMSEEKRKDTKVDDQPAKQLESDETLKDAKVSNQPAKPSDKGKGKAVASLPPTSVLHPQSRPSQIPRPASRKRGDSV